MTQSLVELANKHDLGMFLEIAGHEDEFENALDTICNLVFGERDLGKNQPDAVIDDDSIPLADKFIRYAVDVVDVYADSEPCDVFLGTMRPLGYLSLKDRSKSVSYTHLTLPTTPYV